MDFSKLGSSYYKSLVKLKKFTEHEEKQALDFCKQHPNVTYFITCVWPWDVEIEIEGDEKTFLDILRKFRELMKGAPKKENLYALLGDLVKM